MVYEKESFYNVANTMAENLQKGLIDAASKEK